MLERYRIGFVSRRQKAIFDNETGEQVSQCWNDIYEKLEQSEYYVAEDQENKWAIFHIDNPDQPISQWWNDIDLLGLSIGQSQYYLAINQDHKCAIFHKDNPNEPVTQWWEEIEFWGLLTGESPYYVVKTQSGKMAIFHQHNSHQPLSQWWDKINAYGLTEGVSQYYIAQNQQNDSAIFHINNPDEPITPWCKYIYRIGLLRGTSECYAVIEKINSPIKIYHPIDNTQPLYELPNIHQDALLYFDEGCAIYLTEQHLMLYDSINMQHNVISQLSAELQYIIHEIYQHNRSYSINTLTTNRLIAQYMNYNFLPITIASDTEYSDLYYLYTLDGNYIGKFKKQADMIEYIQKEISKKMDLSCDMIRLY